MKVLPLQFPTKHEPYQKVLFEFTQKGVQISFGTVFFQKGTRIPKKGFTRHPQHEISYLQSGKIQMLEADGTQGGILKAGDVIKMDAFEPQAGQVLEDTQIIYLLVG